VLVLHAATGPAAADRMVGQPGLMGIDAFGGRLIGMRSVSCCRARLALVLPTGARDLPLRAFGRVSAGAGFDIGAGRSGQLIAVYARCGAKRRCDLYRFDFGRRRERRIRSLSTRADELSPAFSNGRLAFTRRGKGGGLFKTGPLRRIYKRPGSGLDLRGDSATFELDISDASRLREGASSSSGWNRTTDLSIMSGAL
jgi:hypothetical protein